MDPRRYTLSTTVGAILWVPALVIAGYYGADLLGQYPWVRTSVTIAGIVFFVVGTGWGIWRYRQEMNRTSPGTGTRPAEVTADN
jgi:membrane-associated protein